VSELEEIEELRRQLVRPGMTAGEFAELLPERLRGPYWRTKLAELCRMEGIDPDAEVTP
jgi:hypothetical protein